MKVLNFFKENRHLLVFLSILLCSCDQQEQSFFYGYYDKEHKVIHQQGEINKQGSENGIWKIYSPDGLLIQTGRYENGLPIGKWTYQLLDYLDTTLNWNIHNINKFRFSLPSSYQNFTTFSKNESSIIFKDSLTNALITIAKYPIKEIGIEEYSKLNRSEMLKKLDIEYYKLDKVTTTNRYHYLEQYNFLISQDNINSIQYFAMIENGSDFFVLNHTSYQKDSLKSKFIIGEVFYHIFYDGQRLYDPLHNTIESISTRDEYVK